MRDIKGIVIKVDIDDTEYTVTFNIWEWDGYGMEQSENARMITNIEPHVECGSDEWKIIEDEVWKVE